VAVKLEHDATFPSHLTRKAEAYAALAGGAGVPSVHRCGRDGEFRGLAMQLLGPSLDDLLAYCSGCLSPRTVLLLADQLVPRLRHVHARGYVHRDLKPSNLMVWDGAEGSAEFVVDLGLARETAGARAGPRGRRGAPSA
jgi:serine/threonine protein kinase